MSCISVVKLVDKTTLCQLYKSVIIIIIIIIILFFLIFFIIFLKFFIIILLLLLLLLLLYDMTLHNVCAQKLTDSR